MTDIELDASVDALESDILTGVDGRPLAAIALSSNRRKRADLDAQADRLRGLTAEGYVTKLWRDFKTRW